MLAALVNCYHAALCQYKLRFTVHDGRGIADGGVTVPHACTALCIFDELERVLQLLRGQDAMQQQRDRVTSTNCVVCLFQVSRKAIRIQALNELRPQHKQT